VLHQNERTLREVRQRFTLSFNKLLLYLWCLDMFDTPEARAVVESYTPQVPPGIAIVRRTIIIRWAIVSVVVVSAIVFVVRLRRNRIGRLRCAPSAL
jgi:hypothetical protein